MKILSKPSTPLNPSRELAGLSYVRVQMPGLPCALVQHRSKLPHGPGGEEFLFMYDLGDCVDQEDYFLGAVGGVKTFGGDDLEARVTSEALGSGRSGDVFLGSVSYYSDPEEPVYEDGEQERPYISIECAVKVVECPYQTLPREAQFYMEYRHENMLKPLGYVWYQGKGYIFIELSRKGSIADQPVNRADAVGLEKSLLKMALDRLKFLSLLHSRNLVYLDGDWSNMFGDVEGSAPFKVGDFESVVSIGESVPVQRFRYSLIHTTYLANLQKGVQPYLDIFQLGVSLYNRLTGSQFPDSHVKGAINELENAMKIESDSEEMQLCYTTLFTHQQRYFARAFNQFGGLKGDALVKIPFVHLLHYLCCAHLISTTVDELIPVFQSRLDRF